MPEKLLKKQPLKKGKLYQGVDESRVDNDIAVFTWDWLKDATKLKDRRTIMAHFEAGHFGPFEIVAEDNYRLMQGHRAICRFNNKKYKDQAVAIYSREQYADVLAGKPMRDATVLIRGKIINKTISLKNYDHNDFIAVRRYMPDQADILAMDRVQIEIQEKQVKWHALKKRSDEYKRLFEERYRFYHSLYLKEIALVAKDTASEEEILRAADLPASIFTLIDSKLTVTQASMYISRWLDFQDIYGHEQMSNPALSFIVHQIISEELLIEHYRDLQRLYGDTIDKPTQDALKDAVKRWQDLMPKELMSFRPANMPDEPASQEPPPGPNGNERTSPAKKSETEFKTS